MANLESIISAKNENDENWKQQRQADRDYVAETRDGGINMVTSNPELYNQYLQLQGDNLSYSPGNIVLCIFQLKDPTIIGTQEKWKSMSRYVLDAERNHGAKIFVRPSNPQAKGYTVGYAYDLSQTQGKPIQPMTMEDDSPQMEKALTGLLNACRVDIVADKSLELPAWYDERDMKLLVNPDVPDAQAFAGIATEIALSRMHDRGYNNYYDHGESLLAAESISYLLCRRFGVERELPDTSGIVKMYSGLSVESRSNALNFSHDLTKKIGNSVEKQIGVQQRTMNQAPQRRAR